MQKVFGQVMNGQSMTTSDRMTLYIEYRYWVSTGD
jgi:hypothetical protein